jgi:hypothetical protein
MHVIAMPVHPPRGPRCPGTGTPVQPMMQVYYTNAQAKLLQQLGELQTKMIATQRAQANAYKTLEELRLQADEVERQFRELMKK